MSRPSKRRTRRKNLPGVEASCEGKRGYANWPVADRMAERTRRDTEDALSPYHCRFCQRWHVGHPLLKRK